MYFLFVFYLLFNTAGDKAACYGDDDINCCPLMFSTALFDIAFDDRYYNLYFEDINYDTDNGMLIFHSKKSIHHIDVIQNETQAQKLLVLSHHIRLDENIFALRDTELVFWFDESERSFSMDLSFK